MALASQQLQGVRFAEIADLMLPHVARPMIAAIGDAPMAIAETLVPVRLQPVRLDAGHYRRRARQRLQRLTADDIRHAAVALYNQRTDCACCTQHTARTHYVERRVRGCLFRYRAYRPACIRRYIQGMERAWNSGRRSRTGGEEDQHWNRQCVQPRRSVAGAELLMRLQAAGHTRSRRRVRIRQRGPRCPF